MICMFVFVDHWWEGAVVQMDAFYCYLFVGSFVSLKSGVTALTCAVWGWVALLASQCLCLKRTFVLALHALLWPPTHYHKLKNNRRLQKTVLFSGMAWCTASRPSGVLPFQAEFEGTAGQVLIIMVPEFCLKLCHVSAMGPILSLSPFSWFSLKKKKKMKLCKCLHLENSFPRGTEPAGVWKDSKVPAVKGKKSTSFRYPAPLLGSLVVFYSSGVWSWDLQSCGVHPCAKAERSIYGATTFGMLPEKLPGAK